MTRGILRFVTIAFVVLVLSWAVDDSPVLANQLTFSVRHFALDVIPLEVRSGDFNGDGAQDLTAPPSQPRANVSK